jgi:hypothetical protein
MNTTKKTGRAPYFVKHPKLEKFEELFHHVKTAAADLKEAKEQVGNAKGTLPGIYQIRRGRQDNFLDPTEDEGTLILKAMQRFAAYEVKRAVFSVRIKRLHVQQRLLREFLHANGAFLLQQLTLDDEHSIYKFNVINAAQLLEETEAYALMCIGYNESLPIFLGATELEAKSIFDLVRFCEGVSHDIVIEMNGDRSKSKLEREKAAQARLKQMETRLSSFDQNTHFTWQFFDCADCSDAAAAITNLQANYHRLCNALKSVTTLAHRLALDAGANSYEEWRTHGLLVPQGKVKALDYELHRIQLVKAVQELKLLLLDRAGSILQAYCFYAQNPKEAQDVSGDELIAFQHNLMCLGKLLAEALYSNSMHYIVICGEHYSILNLHAQYQKACQFLEGKGTLKNDGILSQAQWYNAKGSDWHNMIRAVQSDSSIEQPLASLIVGALRVIISDEGFDHQRQLQLIEVTLENANLIEAVCEWFSQAGWNVTVELLSFPRHLILSPM